MLNSRLSGGKGGEIPNYHPGTPWHKGDPDAKNSHMDFVDIDRATTQQRLNLVHDRSFGSSHPPHKRISVRSQAQFTQERKQICMQICVQTLWCCMQPVWTLPLTTMCSIVCMVPSARCSASCVNGPQILFCDLDIAHSAIYIFYWKQWHQYKLIISTKEWRHSLIYVRSLHSKYCQNGPFLCGLILTPRLKKSLKYLQLSPSSNALDNRLISQVENGENELQNELGQKII